MSDINKDFDEERYLNDSEYRKSILEQRKSGMMENGSAVKRFWSKITSTPMRSLMTLLGFIFLSGAIAGIFFLLFLIQGLPSIEELENPRTDMASFVMSRDGQVLDTYFVENRRYISIDDISPYVVNALIATEDHRFFQHWGIDSFRTLAIPYHILRGDPQGGSTISQQLARNLYRQIGRDFTVWRKLREMITAIQIERNYTKHEIIEMYLNTVEFSNSAFGIESAARAHFNKTSKELTIPEAATLIGTLQAVSYFNPRFNPERSKYRRNIVLSQMGKRGFITRGQFAELSEADIQLDYQRPHQTTRQSRYFGEYVRLQITTWASENGYDIYRDGLVVHTTIDSRMQNHAERVMAAKIDSLQTLFVKEWGGDQGKNQFMNRLWKDYPNFLPSFIEDSEEFRQALAQGGNTRAQVLDSLLNNPDVVDKIKRQRARLEGGFVAIEPGTGHILAWVGGTDYSTIQRDNVYSLRRQAGSTFKPFVYAVAIDNGYKPYHKFSRYPISFRDSRGRRWQPNDMSIGQGPEMVSMREAFSRSLNNVTVRLLPELAGAPDTDRLEDLYPAARMIAEMARRMGIRSEMEMVPAIALGTAEVSLLELVSSYTTFANNGVYIEPMAISRIEDRDGNVLYEHPVQLQQEVISPETAYVMVDMMRGVIRGGDWGFGTGVRMRNMGIRQDVAGKTGTTQNSADNWFIAMFPHVVAGSWVGGEDRRIRFPSNTVIGQGARTALPIVAEWALQCINDDEINWSYEGFEQPVGYIPDPPQDEIDRLEREADRDDNRGRIEW